MPSRAGATPPMPRSTRSCRPAWSSRTTLDDLEAALRDRPRGRRSGDRARRRHLAERPADRRGARGRLQPAPQRGEDATTREQRTVTVEPGRRARAAQRPAQARRAVLPGRALDREPLHHRRHDRQQLLRRALDLLRQDGRQRARGRRHAPRRRALLVRPGRQCERRSRRLRPGSEPRRRGCSASRTGSAPRSRRVSRRCSAGSAATTSTASSRRCRTSPISSSARKARSRSQPR